MSGTSRDSQLKVRINARERQAFEKAAEIAGLTLSAWVRMVLRERVAVAGAEKSRETRVVKVYLRLAVKAKEMLE